MKTSVKILSGIAIGVLVILIVQLARVRTDLQYYMQRSESTRYKTTVLDTFHAIHLSSNWNVRIRQGKEFKVQLDLSDTLYQPSFNLVGETLHFDIDSGAIAGRSFVHAKIITPKLSSIESDSGSVVDIEGFSSDSLIVLLSDGCVFTGRRNELQKISFKSSGDARIDLTETDDF
jgi:hypothetical protein